jgi:hypothetical protein
MHRASALALTCAVLTFTAASCGESGSAGPGDPAALVPADAALYVEAAVQPQGGRREDALAAAGKIMRTDDPAAKLRGLIDEQLAEEGDGLTWERDFASWLGEEAGVWASNLQRGEPSFAVIVASAEADNAKSALARIEQTSESEYTGRSYAGLDYKVDGDGMAHGIVDDFVVLGTESGFKRTADTRDGDKLVDSERYEEAIGELEEDRLGHFYLDAKLVADAALEQDPAAAGELEQFKSLLPLDKLGPITGAFTADGDGMTLDTVVTACRRGPSATSRSCGRATRASCCPSCPATPGRPSRPRTSARRRSRSSPGSRARSGAPRSRRRSRKRPAWTSRRTSSPGSATSACSFAAATWRPSTARSSSPRRTTRAPRRRSARSSA